MLCIDNHVYTNIIAMVEHWIIYTYSFVGPQNCVQLMKGCQKTKWETSVQSLVDIPVIAQIDNILYILCVCTRVLLLHC